MLECHGCHRHVRLHEPSCPFCGVELRSAPAPVSSAGVLLALALGCVLLACADRTSGDAGDSASSDTATTTTTGTTTSEAESSTSTSDTSTTTITTLGDGDGDTNDDWAEEAAAYAGPDDWEEDEVDVGDGDGDGDTQGDGDGDSPTPCAEFGVEAVTLGVNEVFILDGPSLIEGECGAPGPEGVYSFTAPADGFFEFTLTSEAFEGALSLAGEICDPLELILCEVAPVPISLGLSEGVSINLVVDSFAGAGLGTLEISTN